MWVYNWNVMTIISVSTFYLWNWNIYINLVSRVQSSRVLESVGLKETDWVKTFIEHHDAGLGPAEMKWKLFSWQHPKIFTLAR